MSGISNEAETLVSRIAAALFRGDAAHANELAQEAIDDALKAGAERHALQIQHTAQHEERMTGGADAVFVTRDRVSMESRIPVKGGPPMIVRRPMVFRHEDAMSVDPSARLRDVHRDYRYHHRDDRGRLVYCEV